MQSTQGAAAYFFFPTTDQDLSQMNMPYPKCLLQKSESEERTD